MQEPLPRILHPLERTLDHGAVQNAGFHWPVRVYHEDTDDGGIVYHASYLRFMERARTEWLRSLGFAQQTLRNELNVMFVVTQVHVDFLKPARFDDIVTVSVELDRKRPASMEITQNISHDEGELLCRGQVRVACVDATRFRPHAIPKALLQELRG